MVLIVFATNIHPSKLVDEAFLRRIQYKILAENPTRQGFKQIFEKVCRENDLEYDDALVEHLLSTFYEPRGIKMRGCQPRDVIGRAMSHAAYMGYPHKLTNELLETACESYFVNDSEDSMADE
jgi:SpoVK/Ycf46/Vps4 family AAA+-type ATPase